MLSERFSAPLGLLAEGTRAVAQGDFTRRQPVTSRDELGVLTESFNTMTAQLAEAQQKTEESRRATETTRAYLESILGNLSAGVLAFDDRYRLRTANASAAVILQQPLAELTGTPLSDWGRKLPALAPVRRARRGTAFAASRDAHWQKQAELSVANLMRTLLMRGSRLPVTPGGRLRRRVRRRHRSRAGAARRRVGRGRAPPRARDQESADADPAFGRAARAQARRRSSTAPTSETLARGAQTIIAQVAAMKHMVDDFAIYARQPRPGTMQPVDVGALLLDVLALYDNLRPHVALSPSARAARRAGRADPPPPGVPQPPAERHRRPGRDRPSRATTSRSRRAATRSRSRSATRGAGFPDAVLHRAFEPYVTTKAKGTGLGLAIVKKIVDEHHGRVELANARRAGRSVTLIFPRSAAAA